MLPRDVTTELANAAIDASSIGALVLTIYVLIAAYRYLRKAV